MTVRAGILRELSEAANHPLGVSVALLLAWVAIADDEVDVDEYAALGRLAEANRISESLQQIVAIAKRGNPEDLAAASRTVAKASREIRHQVLDLAIGVALADGKLVTTENMVLRWIAECTALGEPGLQAAFRRITGQPMPPVGDASSVRWWESVEGRQRYSKSSGSSQESHSAGKGRAGSITNAPTPQRLRDLFILGLDEGATIEDARAAFRRMAAIHHPDKYASLGPEAVSAAEETFRRIRAAYERLVAA